MGKLPSATCTPCRDRHLKCSKTLPSCQNCLKSNRACHQQVVFKYKGNSNTIFPSDQKWLGVTGAVCFYDETNDVVNGTDTIPDSFGGWTPSDVARSPSVQGHGRECIGTSNLIGNNVQPTTTLSPQSSQRSLIEVPNHDSQLSTFLRSSGIYDADVPNSPSNAIEISISSPIHVIPATGRNVMRAEDSPHNCEHVYKIGSGPSGGAQNHLFPLSDKKEALLFNYFVRKLAPWFDLCDVNRHFAVEIPKRASQSVPLLDAILAVSARQLSVIEDYDPAASDIYYQRCLELIIPALAENNAGMNEDILAATVICRLRAEFEVPLTGIDDQCHLLGTQALIRQWEHTSEMSNLQKAVAWVGLRQEIRIAFISQRATNFPLHIFSEEWIGTPESDEDWANSMILHLAEILNFCFGTQTLTLAEHARLSARANSWTQHQPSFTPLFFRAHAEKFYGLFPECVYINDAVVVGMQHYHLSRILLAFHHPLTRRLGPGHSSTLRNMNDIIDDSVRQMCGIGLSNPDCPCALGLACMAITMCGDRFSSDQDQKEFQAILLIAKEKYAWQTTSAQV